MTPRIWLRIPLCGSWNMLIHIMRCRKKRCVLPLPEIYPLIISGAEKGFNTIWSGMLWRKLKTVQMYMKRAGFVGTREY